MTTADHTPEPLCWHSIQMAARDGVEHPTSEDGYPYQTPGPHRDCSCDVCFYGQRDHWIAGRDAALAEGGAATTMYLRRLAAMIGDASAAAALATAADGIEAGHHNIGRGPA